MRNQNLLHSCTKKEQAVLVLLFKYKTNLAKMHDLQLKIRLLALFVVVMAILQRTVLRRLDIHHGGVNELAANPVKVHRELRIM